MNVDFDVEFDRCLMQFSRSTVKKHDVVIIMLHTNSYLLLVP